MERRGEDEVGERRREDDDMRRGEVWRAKNKRNGAESKRWSEIEVRQQERRGGHGGR